MQVIKAGLKGRGVLAGCLEKLLNFMVFFLNIGLYPILALLNIQF